MYLGNPKNADNTPDFVDDSTLPKGLDKKLGVEFKPGKKPKGQKTPKITQSKKKAIIRGLDHKPIKIDLETSERINVYSPEQFTLSNDGTYVTENESGQVFKLNTFYASDDKNQQDVMYSLDEDGYLTDVRVFPKDGIEKDKKGDAQNFQQLEETDILMGFYDSYVDTSNNPVLEDIEVLFWMVLLGAVVVIYCMVSQSLHWCFYFI